VRSGATKQFLHDELADLERHSVLRFIDERPVAGIVFSLAFSAALLPLGGLPAAIPLIAGAVMNPQVGLIATRRFNKKARAITHLQALL
jgi:hypothetical protein